MPPVFGPVSPSPTRLKSCAGASGTTVSPSQMQKSEASGPSRNSSTTTRPPGLARQPRACSRATSAVVGDDHALARGEPVVLDDVGCAERVEGRGHLLLVGAHVRHPGRDPGHRHDLLGEGLAALQPGRLGRRPEARDAGSPHGVGDPRHERGLRPDDDEVDAVATGQRDDGLGVGGPPGQWLAQGGAGDAGVAGRRDDRVDGRVAGQCADDGVLAGTGTDDEDLHGPTLEVSESRPSAGHSVPSREMTAPWRHDCVTSPAAECRSGLPAGNDDWTFVRCRHRATTPASPASVSPSGYSALA